MKKLLFFFLLLVSATTYAQDSALGNWMMYFGNHQINTKFNWHSELQYRNYNAIGDLEQLLIRTGIGYNLSENNNNILLGYGFIHSQNYQEDGDKANSDEHRIYQQFITKQKFGRTTLQHRYRFEQRFLGDDFKVRWRYFLSINVALTAKEIVDRTLYFSAYNEIFIQTEGNYFDRNRLYGGLGYKFSKTLRMELGYMNQWFAEGSRDQINVFAFVSF